MKPKEIAEKRIDYENIFDAKVNGFFCPLTQEAKPVSEICDGHVFSRKFAKSRTDTVIQWKPIDVYYGQKFEGHLVGFWKKTKMTAQERLKAGDFYILAPDGSKHEVVFAHTEEGHRLRKLGFGQLTFDETIAGPVTVQFDDLTPDDLMKGGGRYELMDSTDFIPIMVSAAMMKAGFLTLFWLMGYRCLLNPLVRRVGDALAASYEAKADVTTAHQFFGDYQNAYATLERRTSFEPLPNGTYQPWHFDTITSKHAIELVHDNIQFAFNFVYDVDGVTIVGTFPYTRQPEDADAAWEMYKQHLWHKLEGEVIAVQSKWDGNCWQPQGIVPYFETASAVDHAKFLLRSLKRSNR